MKKFIYGFVLIASILGVIADEECPNTLSQEQMKELADKGSITINGTKFTTQDQAIIKEAIPSGKNLITKLTDKSAHSEYQEMSGDSSTLKCGYKFRTYSQKLTKEEYVRFSISPPQKPSRPSTLPPEQGVREKLKLGSSGQSLSPTDIPSTPRPTTRSNRPLPSIPQPVQHHDGSTAQQTANTGTFTFHRDKEGKVITSTFAKENMGQRGQTYTESRVKDILYIHSTDGKEYVWYDPTLNNQDEYSAMMKTYNVGSMGGLEGKSVKFEPTGKKMTIEGKEYELVTAIPTP